MFQLHFKDIFVVLTVDNINFFNRFCLRFLKKIVLQNEWNNRKYKKAYSTLFDKKAKLWGKNKMI